LTSLVSTLRFRASYLSILYPYLYRLINQSRADFITPSNEKSGRTAVGNSDVLSFISFECDLSFSEFGCLVFIYVHVGHLRDGPEFA
jgi:hypothetical protein